MTANQIRTETGVADEHMPNFRRLPEVQKVCGAFFNPTQMKVQLQYESDGVIYELSLPIEEILKSEDWFIEIRRHVGASMKEQKEIRRGK